MKKTPSLVRKILLLILITGVVMGAAIITSGVLTIYEGAKSEIRTEICNSGMTMKNIICSRFDGDIRYEDNVCYFGDKVLSVDDFKDAISLISCDEAVDFTLFYSDIRVFTTVSDSSGKIAVGTRAAEEVTEAVLKGGKDYLSDKVLVNGEYYMGYYMPIKSHDGTVTGMFFAGKPLIEAAAYARSAIFSFVLLAVIILIAAIVVTLIIVRRMVVDLEEIKDYIGKVSQGDFNAQLSDKTLGRNDEIGDIGASSKVLCENLRDMVERDPLTTLLNRRSFLSRLDVMKNDGKLTLMICDIDFFKRINDTYGHTAGDDVLRSVSSVLDEKCRENSGYACRWGGEEFLLALPCDSAEALKLAEEMMDIIRATECVCEDNVIKVTITIGIAQHDSGRPLNDTINLADDRLYKGKNAGRNRAVSE